MATIAISRKEEVRSYILEAADILRRQVDTIVADYNDEPVTGIYITLRVSTPDMIPELTVEKSYASVRKDLCENKK